MDLYPAAPVTLYPHALGDIDLRGLQADLTRNTLWEKKDGHRLEALFLRGREHYYFNQNRGLRPLRLQPETAALTSIWAGVEDLMDTKFHACFVNLYLGEGGCLGWHADDSPSIDPDQPVCVYSLGESSTVQFRENLRHNPDPLTVTIADGTLYAMHAGMQQTHQHRVPPQNGREGERLSLVFRALRTPVEEAAAVARGY